MFVGIRQVFHWHPGTAVLRSSTISLAYSVSIGTGINGSSSNTEPLTRAAYCDIAYIYVFDMYLLCMLARTPANLSDPRPTRGSNV